MRYSSQPKPISYLKTNAADVQDVASPEEIQETLALLKILALGKQELSAGKVKPLSAVVARLRARRATD